MTIPLRHINSITTAGAAVLLLVVLGGSAAAEPPDKAEPQTAMAKLAPSMKPGQWAELKTNGLGLKVFSDGGHHALQYTDEAVWDPGHKVVVFGGGNDSKGYRSKDLWKLDASGQVSKLRETPLPIGVTGTIFTVDPASGKYLVFGRQGQVYEYDVTADTWTELKGQQPPIFTFGPDLKGSAIFGCVATPVSSHGVVMFVKYDGDNSKVFLYRHAPAGEQP